jgi:hypothetical protein
MELSALDLNLDLQSLLSSLSPGSFPVTLKLQTDSYPGEIGWYLERLDLDETVSISMIPFGFYTTSNELIEREMMVTDGGFYRFSIFDSNGDGICCTDAQGSIELMIGEDKRVVTSELGITHPGPPSTFSVVHPTAFQLYPIQGI